MICKVQGCGRDAMYKAQKVCQKHYFRFMRNGTYSNTRFRKYRITNPAGYQKVFEPIHPLSDCDGYVYEHRMVAHKKYNEVVPDCEICGCQLTWDTVHIDHINEDVTYNFPDNLRPLCMDCNTKRGKKMPEHKKKGRSQITFDGITQTATEWARDDRVIISNAQILYRKRIGMSDFDALFSPKKTHTQQLKRWESA